MGLGDGIMIGAIAGDIIGSVYERHANKNKDFDLFGDYNRFTDDTVLTVALADSLLTGTSYIQNLKRFFDLYPHAGYGGNFIRWAQSRDTHPYGSYGNGAAMRISPVGFAFDDMKTVLEKAEAFTAVTHNHPEGIKGGQSVAAAILLARQGESKREIQQFITSEFNYDLSRTVDEIRPGYRFDVSCQGSVPQAIRAFLDSVDFEDALRTAVSLGGDSDTIACITGGIAQAFYGAVPEDIQKEANEHLDDRLREITGAFLEQYG